MPALLHQGGPHPFAAGDAQGRGAVVLQAGDQHPLQLGLVLGGHHREVGHAAQVTDVVLALVGGAIGANDAGPVHHERDGQVLDAHVVDQLVVGALQEGAVDGAHGAEPFTGHAGGHGDGVLLGDAHIEVLVGAGLLQQVEAGAGGHGGGDAHHPGILLADLHQRLAKHLAVAGGFGFAGGVGLAGGQVEGALGVVTHLVGFGVGVTLALGGGHVHQHGPLVLVGLLEHLHHAGDVVAVHGPHVGEAQLLKHGPQLGHRQALHALLEVLELRGQLPVQEGEVLDGLLGVVLQELQRLAVPHAVEVGGEGPHRRADRHVVVVQHHQQAGFGQVAGVVDRLQGHATGERPVADHRHTFERLAALIPRQGHAQGRGDRGAGMAGTEVVETAFAALQIARHAVLLAQGVEVVVAAGDQLVGIGLVAHIPHHPVVVEVEGLVEGQGEFHHPQAGAEVATAGAHHLQVAFTDLAGDALQLGGAQAVQLIRVRQLTEVHA